MGVRIDMENKIDDLERRMKLLEGAVEEITRDHMNMSKTRHIDLVNDVKKDIKKNSKSKARKKEAVATT
jgi:archaellum component FlaC